MKTYLFNDFWGKTDQFFQRSRWLVIFAMNVGCFSLRQIPWTFISNLMKLEVTTVSNVASHSQRGQPSNGMLEQFMGLLWSVLVVASSSKGSKKCWSTKRNLTLRKHVHFARKSLRTHEALRGIYLVSHENQDNGVSYNCDQIVTAQSRVIYNFVQPSHVY